MASLRQMHSSQMPIFVVFCHKLMMHTKTFSKQQWLPLGIQFTSLAQLSSKSKSVLVTGKRLLYKTDQDDRQLEIPATNGHSRFIVQLSLD